MNTLGNWSDDSTCLKQRHRTPYVISANYGGPEQKGGFPDVANPGFRSVLPKALPIWHARE